MNNADGVEFMELHRMCAIASPPEVLAIIWPRLCVVPARQ